MAIFTTTTTMPPVKPPRVQNPKFVVRLPDDLRDQIKEVAYRNRRSMNSELILAVEVERKENAIGGESITVWREIESYCSCSICFYTS